jgi:hypothetical protein
MKGNIKVNDQEKVSNTVGKDTKKYQDDIVKLEKELGYTETKLMVRDTNQPSQKR